MTKLTRLKFQRCTCLRVSYDIWLGHFILTLTITTGIELKQTDGLVLHGFLKMRLKYMIARGIAMLHAMKFRSWSYCNYLAYLRSENDRKWVIPAASQVTESADQRVSHSGLCLLHVLFIITTTPKPQRSSYAPPMFRTHMHHQCVSSVKSTSFQGTDHAASELAASAPKPPMYARPSPRNQRWSSQTRSSASGDFKTESNSTRTCDSTSYDQGTTGGRGNESRSSEGEQDDFKGQRYRAKACNRPGSSKDTTEHRNQGGYSEGRCWSDFGNTRPKLCASPSLWPPRPVDFGSRAQSLR